MKARKSNRGTGESSNFPEVRQQSSGHCWHGVGRGKVPTATWDATCLAAKGLLKEWFGWGWPQAERRRWKKAVCSVWRSETKRVWRPEEQREGTDCVSKAGVWETAATTVHRVAPALDEEQCCSKDRDSKRAAKIKPILNPARLKTSWATKHFALLKCQPLEAWRARQGKALCTQMKYNQVLHSWCIDLSKNQGGGKCLRGENERQILFLCFGASEVRKPMKHYPRPTQTSGISKTPGAFQHPPMSCLLACPWSRCPHMNLLCKASSHQPSAAVHLHWSDSGDSALPLQGAAIALLQRWDYSSNPSIITVQLSSRDLWAGKENENYRCPAPMTDPPYISSNKACDNSSINSHSNRNKCQLIIAAI